MSLIDSTYFTLDIDIPTNYTDVLTSYITRYEPEILTKLLGKTLYDLVAAYDADSSPQRIKDIVEGKDYTVSYGGYDQTVSWNGLKNDDGISLIAYYVYYKYMKNTSSLLTPVGVMKSSSENAVLASASEKAFAAWRELERLYGYQGQDILEPSAYNFLMEYESSYDEWVFTELGSVNAFDL